MTDESINSLECRIPVQKDSDDGLMDGPCGELSPIGYNGYCKTHYVEYLCGLVFNNDIDPVQLFELGELQAVFSRSGRFLPSQRAGEYEFQYKKRLTQVRFIYFLKHLLFILFSS